MPAWSELRTEVEQARHRLGLPDSEFRPLNVTEWPGIEERMRQTFCRPNSEVVKPLWLWERFKREWYSFWSDACPVLFLNKLVDHQETVWLVLNEDFKFWFYEGRIQAISEVLAESCYIDEIYVMSKKYDWLLCINHHDVLYATGNLMPARLRRLKKNNG